MRYRSCQDTGGLSVTSNIQWIQELAEAPFSERGTMLAALVTGEFRARLLMTEADFLPLDESYFALGLTSIGAVEIQQRLEEVLGRRIDSSNLFNHPTIRHLLDHLCGEVLADLFRGPAAPKEAAAEPAAGIAGTSPRELAQEAVSPASGAQRSSPKELLNHLLDELYEA